jgi:exosortase
MAWTTTTSEKDHSNPEGLSKVGHIRPMVQQILPFSVFGALWYMLIAHLSQHWAVNPQYSFGWFVPVICAYLFLIRWRTRPPVGLAQSGVARWVFWTAGFALLPTWLVEQPNPDWRLIGWLLAFEIVALSLCAIYFVGGRFWLGHFAFSICFILISVPWPGAMDDLVGHGLTQATTVVTTGLLNLFHISAVQHGNLIEVKTGLLGIDEACSGIRSLQATLMISLFFGELYRASKLRRVFLVLCGALIAFLCNVGRTFFLAAIAAKDGIEAISNWHDPLGFTALAICLFLVWILARLDSGPIPKPPSSNVPAPNPLPWRLALGLGAWVMFTIIGVEAWYRAHETQGKLRWAFAWPVEKKDFSDVAFSKLEADELACDEKRGAEWTNGDGSHWMAYFFKWVAGPIRSRILARMHRPEFCLPAAGYKVLEDRGTITIKAKNLLIPFHALDFEYAGEQVYVFFCLWEDRSKQPDHPRIRDDWTWFARLESVLLGEHNLGQQTLEIVVSGYDKPEEAEAALRSEIGTMIKVYGV